MPLFTKQITASSKTALAQVQNKLATGSGQLKIVTFGDSYGPKLYLGAEPVLLGLAQGQSGAGFQGTHSKSVTINATTGTVTAETTAWDAWPSGLTERFSSGATRTYGTFGVTGMNCDTVKVYYVKEPGAGTFKLQVDGVDAVGFTNISAAGTLGQLGVATLNVTAGTHTLTVVNLTGFHRLIGVVYYTSTTTGLLPINVSQGGITLTNAVSSTGLTNFQAFLADIQPDLLTFEMKESDTGFRTAATALLTACSAGYAAMDVFGIGTPPTSTSDSDNVSTNATLESLCRQFSYAYYNTYDLFGSYTNLQRYGFEGDGTHVSTACDQYRAMHALEDLGLMSTYGVNLFQSGGKVPGFTFGRSLDGAPIASIVAEPSFGLDLQVMVDRMFRVYNLDGSTEIARYRPGLGNSFMPDGDRVGSATGPGLVATNQTTIEVRRGDQFASQGDLSVRHVTRLGKFLSAQSGAVSIDCNEASTFWIELGGNITSFSITNAPAEGAEIVVMFRQDLTGGHTLTGIDPTIRLSGGALTITSTANRWDVLKLIRFNSAWIETSRVINLV